jgi:hypothetical protein
MLLTWLADYMVSVMQPLTYEADLSLFLLHMRSDVVARTDFSLAKSPAPYVAITHLGTGSNSHPASINPRFGGGSTSSTGASNSKRTPS